MIKPEDAASLREIINFSSGKPIRLGKAEIGRLTNYWDQRYEGNKKSDLDGTLERIRDWEEYAKSAYISAGKRYCLENGLRFPEGKDGEMFEKCFYLSIPESYWKLDADSGVAVGPFQFTRQTAKTWGLKRGGNFDERRDPIKSAEAAAKNILNLYFNLNRDWKLAISGYNGAFVWDFKKEATAKKQEVNYDNFLAYLAGRMNEIKKELSLPNSLTHTMMNGDTPGKIAELYGISENLLKKMNPGVDFGKLIPKETKLKIPPTEKNRAIDFYRHIDGYAQNINYPAKLDAVLAVLEKYGQTGNKRLGQKSRFFWKEIVVNQEKPYFEYATKGGDTLSGIATRFKLNVEEVRMKNKLGKNGKLKAGMKLEIRNKNKPKTLYSLASQNKKQFELFETLNPAIKDGREALPDGYRIRVPLSPAEALLAKK